MRHLVPALVLACTAALAAPRPASARPLRTTDGPYQLQVLVEGQAARTFEHRGESWVLGDLGARYTLRVVNRSARRIEAVVTVDGRDVIDGKPGDFRTKRGYLVPAWGSVDIDGWRISQSEAAAFRFSSVSDSYAVRTGGGREVGVIGVAVFPEREPPRPVYVPRPPRRPYPEPWGGDRERFDDGGAGGESRGAAPPSASSSAPSSPMKERSAARDERPGLGTSYGEAVSSEVREVQFVRANPSTPSLVLGARYNDHDGLVALGIPVDPPARCYSWGCDPRESADPFPLANQAIDRRYAPPPPGWSR